MAAAVLVATAWAASAQEVTYALPSTTVRLKVSAVKERFYAGPYARYAKKYLGIDARPADQVSSYITAINVIPTVEADLNARYTLSGGSADLLALSAQGLVSLGQNAPVENTEFRFQSMSRGDFSTKAVTSGLSNESTTLYRYVRTDSTYNRVAVQQSVVVEKSAEKRAQEAADMILKIRQEKFNITIGNTDATFSGEALGAAIDELTRMEEEYMTMFVGYADLQEQELTFDVIPQNDEERMAYVAFRLSDTDGLVAPDNLSGRPYYLEFYPEPYTFSPARPAKGRVIRYRIPLTCTVVLTDGVNQLLQTRVPVYQLGEEATYPAR